MYSKFFLLPYKMASESAKALSEETGALRLNKANSRFVPADDKLVINWGCSSVPPKFNHAKFFNHPVNVALATNKLTFLRAIQADNSLRHFIPDFTEDRKQAELWAEIGEMVVCRTVLNGHSGQGIVLAKSPLEVVAAPLYTKYEKKKEEFRIHVFDGRVIDRQKKLRSKDAPKEDVNWHIRNLSNGFVYGRMANEEGYRWPKRADQLAVFVCKLLGLDFGAVDIIHNVNKGLFLVLEVNTSPGLTGTTLQNYKTAINRLVLKKGGKKVKQGPIIDEFNIRAWQVAR